MESCRRPNRSDIHLSKEEEVKIEEETRDHFDDLAPKRHTKPQRSEYSSTYTDALNSINGVINPEYAQFQLLEKDSQKLVYNGSKAAEEFMETEYYSDLNCIDKQHHRTGTGFIKVENTNGVSFSVTPDAPTQYHASCKGNPATNDWIPASADTMNFESDKPNRSDN
ncbi:maternal effect [Abeliophyllum distichum]|uniref:Maternal effect n=1 Tax=Abeliophyllum distichum TaxID=126358 RepID=A0ABD1RD84_9LAMI